MPAPPTSKQQQSIKSPANQAAARGSAQPSGGFSQTQFGGGTTTKRSGTGGQQTTVPGGYGMQAYSGIQRSYANPATYSPNVKDQSRVPQQAAFNPGGSPYPNGQTPPPWPGSFPTATPRPVSRVAGGLGALAYAPIGNSYQPKAQDRLPAQGTMMARDPSLAGRAAQASANMFGGGVPGGFGMQAYETYNPQVAAAGNDGMVEGVMDGTGPGYTGGEGFVPDSTNPVTNASRRIAERLSGPFARADRGLSRLSGGRIRAYDPTTETRRLSEKNGGSSAIASALMGQRPSSGIAPTTPGTPAQPVPPWFIWNQWPPGQRPTV